MVNSYTDSQIYENIYQFTKLAKINNHKGDISHHWRKEKDYLIKIVRQEGNYWEKNIYMW